MPDEPSKRKAGNVQGKAALKRMLKTRPINNTSKDARSASKLQTRGSLALKRNSTLYYLYFSRWNFINRGLLVSKKKIKKMIQYSSTNELRELASRNT